MVRSFGEFDAAALEAIERFRPSEPAEDQGDYSHASVEPATHSILIASGKGGVGKSTMALNLALALSDGANKVGLLDADMYGPDIPRMINLARKKWLQSFTLWREGHPVEIEPLEKHGLRVMSTGFLMADDQPVSMSKSLLEALIHVFLRNVKWGELDYMLIDLPPGTADLQQRLSRLVRTPKAVLVVTPQDVAHLDARKVLTMFENMGVQVIGAIENMSGLRCPDCSKVINLFPRVEEERSIWASGVEKLGELPMDPAISFGSENGKPLMISDPGSEAAATVRSIAARIREVLETDF